MKIYSKFIILIGVILQQQNSIAFPDYPNIIYELFCAKECFLSVCILSIFYINRSCWKRSYENTYALRDKYEKLYLEQTQNLISARIENNRLKNDLNNLQKKLVDVAYPASRHADLKKL